MYAYDFEYDGKCLSEFGFIVCEFDGDGGLKSSESGSEINFITSPIQGGRRFIQGGSKYDKCLTTTFQIAKNPAFFAQDTLVISAEEFRAISRWLNRREFLWFHSFDLEEDMREEPWFRASFKLTKIEIGGRTYGIQLDMTTDAPFGYGPEVEEVFEFDANELTAEFTDMNDEIGETYPILHIVCGDSGTLTLENDRTGCACTIENCVASEELDFSGDTKIVSTNSVSHDIANDFNYDFFRFANSFEDRDNTITASMPCTVEMRYRPILKDTL